MKQQELTLVATSTAEVSPTWESPVSEVDQAAWESQFVYRELADVPVQVQDPLEDLSRSVNQLQDLQARLRFMMREIRSMMKA